MIGCKHTRARDVPPAALQPGEQYAVSRRAVLRKKLITWPTGHLEEDENRWVRCAALHLAAWQHFAQACLFASVLQPLA